MQQGKIDKFYDTYSSYCHLKDDIADAIFRLKQLAHKANNCLNDTVDNGLDSDFVISVKNEYDKHKFNSDVVCSFLEKIDNILLKDLKPIFRESLEVVSLDINTWNIPIDFDAHCTSDKMLWQDVPIRNQVISPLTLNFTSSALNRAFALKIPIRGGIDIDLDHLCEKLAIEGMYCIDAMHPTFKIYTNIYSAFDQNGVASAINKYLEGGFDNDFACCTSTSEKYRLPGVCDIF